EVAESLRRRVAAKRRTAPLARSFARSVMQNSARTIRNGKQTHELRILTFGAKREHAPKVQKSAAQSARNCVFVEDLYHPATTRARLLQITIHVFKTTRFVSRYDFDGWNFETVHSSFETRCKSANVTPIVRPQVSKICARRSDERDLRGAGDL